MTNKEYAEILIPNVEHERKYYEEKYKERSLKEGAMVTRIGPSPTGCVHIGTLYQAIVAKHLAEKSGGVCFLRIEDTDQKREVEDGINLIKDSLANYEIGFDEGPEIKGEYGPYIQSERKDIYRAFVKDLIEKELAYPSFLTEEEKEKMTQAQTKSKGRIGYFGPWAAKERAMTKEEVLEKIKANIPYVIRLKSQGDFEKKVIFEDAIKGRVEMPENDMDIVLLKRDGLPTYHFAHAVDDFLMHTTHVTRGDEWLSSVPIHLELFQVLGVKPPTYAHLATIQKEEDGKRRKISKRKDKEADSRFYIEKGIPIEAVKIYLMTLANSNFEEWMLANPKTSIAEFKMDFSKMSTSGALFDMEKLLNISKNLLSEMSAKEMFEKTLKWASVYDKEFATLLTQNKDVITKTLNIEREGPKPRKDFAMYSEVQEGLWYMINEKFTNVDYDWQKIEEKEEIQKILKTYINNYYEETDTEEEWFNKIKECCSVLGYAQNMKEYKQNPENYKGNVADVSTVIRVALTSKSRTPNLYDIMQILGKEEIQRRFNLCQ